MTAPIACRGFVLAGERKGRLKRIDISKWANAAAAF
jgi:hypothetical protein